MSRAEFGVDLTQIMYYQAKKVSRRFFGANRMIEAAQIRAARGLLDWTQARLAGAAEVPLSAIKALEGGKDTRVSWLAAIERTLLAAGLVFLEPGDVRDGGPGLRFRE